jgi:hypothetical protein
MQQACSGEDDNGRIIAIFTGGSRFGGTDGGKVTCADRLT